MQSSRTGKALDLRVRRVLKTNIRGGIAQSAVDPGGSLASLADSAESVVTPSDFSRPPDNSSSIPNSQTGPASGGGSYTSRGGTRTRK